MEPGIFIVRGDTVEVWLMRENGDETTVVVRVTESEACEVADVEGDGDGVDAWVRDNADEILAHWGASNRKERLWN